MKTIQLKTSGVGRYDDVSPFIVTDNTLHLQIGLPPYNGEFYLVYELNGKVSKRLIPRSGQLILEDLTAGELNAEVKHYLKGELIKTYRVEPLLLKEVEGMLSAIPEMEELRRQINSVETSFTEYKESAAEREKTLVEQLERTEKNFMALMRFALKDYQNNVYLNGGTAQSFISEFGFELMEEQIKLIKGGKDDEQD